MCQVGTSTISVQLLELDDRCRHLQLISRFSPASEIKFQKLLEIFFAMHKMMGSHNLRDNEESKTIEILVDDIVHRLDKDQDGKISLEEFIEGSKSNPTIISKLSQINRKSSLQYSKPVVL